MRKLLLVSVMLLAVPAAEASMSAASGADTAATGQLNVSVPFEKQK